MSEQDKDKQELLPNVFQNNLSLRERSKALTNFYVGRTPPSEIRKRIARGGSEVNYVNIYYLIRQVNLITNSKWSNEALEERYRPNQDNPIEVGVKVKVTIWDKDGNQYVHTAWGQKDVSRYANDDPKGKYKKSDIISLFDDLKAAESDGIKKALSYFGIANDVYGGKEMEFFSDESADSNNNSEIDFTGSDAYKAFGRWLEKNHIRWSEAYQILGTSSTENMNYKEAKESITKHYKEQKGRELV